MGKTLFQEPVSGPAVPQPGVMHQIALAGLHRLSARLRLRAAGVDIGHVDLEAGEVTRVRLPGADGDEAARLLPRLPAIRVDVEPLPAKLPAPTVGAEARAALASAAPSLSPAAQETLLEAFGVRTGPKIEAPAPPHPSPGASAPGLDPDATFEDLVREATAAYLRRAYGQALELFERCARMRPDDRRVAHNLARLRQRLRSPSDAPSPGKPAP